jgi:hypothetical protein
MPTLSQQQPVEPSFFSSAPLLGKSNYSKNTLLAAGSAGAGGLPDVSVVGFDLYPAGKTKIFRRTEIIADEFICAVRS